MNRLLFKTCLPQNPSSNSSVLSHGAKIPPKLFPSLSNIQLPLHLLQNDAESVRKVASDGFCYPCGLPYLEFFLPNADDSSLEPMLLFPKRTFQPSTIRRKRIMGSLQGRQQRLAGE